jgi:hypothetical protein
MNKLTATQIIDIIKDNNISVEDFAYCDFPDLEYKPEYNITEEDYDKLSTNDQRLIVSNYLGIGDWKEVDQYGGEGEGERWYSVKYFKDHDVYIKTNGFYSSYNGTDFDYGYGYEVKPVQKTITVYE